MLSTKNSDRGAELACLLTSAPSQQEVQIHYDKAWSVISKRRHMSGIGLPHHQRISLRLTLKLNLHNLAWSCLNIVLLQMNLFHSEKFRERHHCEVEYVQQKMSRLCRRRIIWFSQKGNPPPSTAVNNLHDRWIWRLLALRFRLMDFYLEKCMGSYTTGMSADHESAFFFWAVPGQSCPP